MTLAISPRLEFERDIVEVQEQIDGLVAAAERSGFDVSDELKELRSKLDTLKESTYQNLTPMEQVQVARHPDRPFTLDYIRRIFTNWVELHGDRSFRDDEAIVGGWASLGGTSVMAIGHQKGRDMKENLHRNFGMSHPEGYRKALRLMRQAEKFGRPVITFIDTPGAYPGIGSEERGIAEAIAFNLRRDVTVEGSAHFGGHRRRGVRRRTRARRDGPNSDARALRLFSDLSGGLRRDLVALEGLQGRGGGGHSSLRRRISSNWVSPTKSSPSSPGEPIRTGTLPRRP